MHGGQLAAMADTNKPQDQLGVHPDLPGGWAGPPSVTGRAEGLASRIAGDLAYLQGLVVENVAPAN